MCIFTGDLTVRLRLTRLVQGQYLDVVRLAESVKNPPNLTRRHRPGDNKQSLNPYPYAFGLLALSTLNVIVVDHYIRRAAILTTMVNM